MPRIRDKQIGPGASDQVLVTNATPDAVWATAAGDWTGNPAANIVGKINGVTAPTGAGNTIGNTLRVTTAGAGGTSAYSALNLAGGAGWITGFLPPGNFGFGAANTVLVTNGAASAAAYALLINANVDAAAAIAGTKINPNFGSQNVTTTGVVNLGANPSVLASGLRLTNDLGISQRRPGGGDLVVVNVSAADEVNFGGVLTSPTVNLGSAVAVAVLAPLVFFYTPQIFFREITGAVASTFTFASATANTWIFAATVPSITFGQDNKTANGGTGAPFATQAQNETGTTSIGGKNRQIAGTGTSSYGECTTEGNYNIGFFSQAMADAPQTVSPANTIKNIIFATGVNSAVRALTLSCPPTAGQMKIVRNNCTVFGITVQFNSGAATATIPPGASAVVIGDGVNAQIAMLGA